MYFYAIYNPAGRIIYKEETEGKRGGAGIVELDAEAYSALDVPNEQEIFDLKAALAATDYIACKIAEGAATAEEYAATITQRQAWRARINELSGENV